MRIHKVASATLMSVIAAGSLIAASSAPATAAAHATRVKPAAFVLAHVTVTPATKLIDKQVVSVAASGFGTATTLFVAECSSQVIAKQSEAYCDTTNLLTLTGVSGGAATTPFTIHTGKDFKATNKAAACGVPAPNCILLVTDSKTISKIKFVGFMAISFKDVRALSKTKVTSKKKVPAKTKVKFTAKSHGIKSALHLSGTVTFFDNGKKFAKVKEKASGKAVAKKKLTKKGKNHITVKYSGDTNFKPSSGKETVKVK